MTDVDRFDSELRQFLAAEARLADTYGSVGTMVDTFTVAARRRAVLPSRTLVFVLVTLALLAALAVSAAFFGSRLRTSYVLVPPPAQPGAIVYALNGEVHVRDVATGDDRVVYRQDEIECCLRGWSQDGARILYDDPDTHVSNTMAPDGSDMTWIAISPHGLWSPGAQLYAANDDATIQIWDLSDHIIQTFDIPGGGKGINNIEWTHDGRALGVGVTVCEDSQGCMFGIPDSPSRDDFIDLWALPIDGGAPYKVYDAVEYGTFYNDGTPGHWSPDDSLVAVTHGSCPARDVCDYTVDVVDAQNGAMVRQIDNASFAGWSPDGAWLSIARSSGSNPDGIWIVHPDGTGLRQVTYFGTLSAWSADSKQIAYWEGDTAELGTIHIVTLDGSGAEQTFTSSNNFDWQHFSQLAAGN